MDRNGGFKTDNQSFSNVAQRPSPSLCSQPRFEAASRTDVPQRSGVRTLTADDVEIGSVYFLAAAEKFRRGSAIEKRDKTAGNPFGHPVLVVKKGSKTCHFFTITTFGKKTLVQKYPKEQRRQHERYIPLTRHAYPDVDFANPTFPTEFVRFCGEEALHSESYIIADRLLEVEYNYLRNKNCRGVRVSMADVSWLLSLDLELSNAGHLQHDPRRGDEYFKSGIRYTKELCKMPDGQASEAQKSHSDAPPPREDSGDAGKPPNPSTYQMDSRTPQGVPDWHRSAAGIRRPPRYDRRNPAGTGQDRGADSYVPDRWSGASNTRPYRAPEDQERWNGERTPRWRRNPDVSAPSHNWRSAHRDNRVPSGPWRRSNDNFDSTR